MKNGFDICATATCIVNITDIMYVWRIVGEMAERSMAADCKSAGVRLRRFESFSPHNFAGVVQWQNTSLPSWSREFDSHHPLVHAYVAQSVEHFLGKEEVTGSNPVVGSRY